VKVKDIHKVSKKGIIFKILSKSSPIPVATFSKNLPEYLADKEIGLIEIDDGKTIILSIKESIDKHIDYNNIKCKDD